jgi:hypothetical protein
MPGPRTPKVPGGLGTNRIQTVLQVPANKALTDHFSVDQQGNVTIKNPSLVKALRDGVAGSGGGTKAISVGVVVDF